MKNKLSKAKMAVIIDYEKETNEEIYGYIFESMRDKLEEQSWYFDEYFFEDTTSELTNEFGETTGRKIDLIKQAKIIIEMFKELEEEKEKAKKFIDLCNKYDLKEFDLIER